MKKNEKQMLNKIKKSTSSKTNSLVSKKTVVKSKSKISLVSDAILGKKFPSIRIPMTGSDDFSIGDYAGQRVVIYFYPKDMTPGCTVEGHEFSALVNEFKKLKTVVLGLSRDPVAKHEKFIEKEGFKIKLISDVEEKACQWFDVIKEKNMYGKKVLGIERSTFLISPNGTIEKVWRKVKAEGHAAEVLNYIKTTI